MAVAARQSLERRPPTRPRAHDLRLVEVTPNPGRYLLMALLLAALGVFAVVSLHALATESAFQARALERDVAGLELRYYELTAEVAALESPEHVAAIATDQLGLVPATDPAYLVAAGDQAPGDTNLALDTSAQGAGGQDQG